jgi:hypothetical protein
MNTSGYGAAGRFDSGGFSALSTELSSATAKRSAELSGRVLARLFFDGPISATFGLGFQDWLSGWSW